MTSITPVAFICAAQGSYSIRNLQLHEVVNTLCMLLSFLQNHHSNREQFCSACRWRPPQIRRLQSNLQWWIRRRSPGVHFLRFQLLSQLAWYQLSQFTSTRYWSAGIEVICWLNCATHWSESYIFHLSFSKNFNKLVGRNTGCHFLTQTPYLPNRLAINFRWGRGSGGGELRRSPGWGLEEGAPGPGATDKGPGRLGPAFVTKLGPTELGPD